MRRAGRRITLLFCAAILAIAALPAFAQSAGDGTPTDTGRAWLDALFHGAPPPSSAPGLEAVTTALHRGFAIYSTGILVIAGLLLFYNLGVMIIETAHYGVPFGRRSAQIWAPLRLVFALAFLVPVTSGLNTGQYLVVWMAGQGSALASDIWGAAAGAMKGRFAALAPPAGPDVAGFVAGGVEMELCRALYNRLLAAVPAGPARQALGPIGDIATEPPSRFAGETWLYTNNLQPSLPLCGAYRFAPTAAGADALSQLDGSLADFARTETSALIAGANPLAANHIAALLSDKPDPGLQGEVAALIAAHRATVAASLKTLTENPSGAVGHVLAASANSGWIEAGGFLMALARRQDMYGTLASHMLPSVQAPLFATGAFMPMPLAKSLDGATAFDALEPGDAASVRAFYLQMQRMAAHAHAWLYDRQLASLPLAFAGPFDLRARAGLAADPRAVASYFSHAFGDAAIAYGVWNDPAANAASPLLALPAGSNPMAALAEFGRRQAAFGRYLFALASPDAVPPGTLAYALLAGLAGLLFILSGLALMFLIPLLPFLRFFLGILAWLLSVFEAVIAVPIVALAHLNLSGEGIGGGALRRVYLLWLGVVIRPALIVFGFIAGLLLFAVAAAFLNLAFGPLLRLAAPDGGGLFLAVDGALTLFYTVLACAAANVAFKGIDRLPDMGLNWLGGVTAIERAEHPQAPASAIAQASAISNLSVTSQTAHGALESRAESRIESRAMAAAKAHGLKAALFPHYGGESKAAGAAAHITATENRTSLSQSRETLRDAAMPKISAPRNLTAPPKLRAAAPKKADPAARGQAAAPKEENEAGREQEKEPQEPGAGQPADAAEDQSAAPPTRESET
ncbi:MAG TPA: DotA/TraY family protein [Alphaproteobacteria bacterium]|nr:DotA/TraY family protein [Alphaproteobacteria bacterium]